MDFVTLSMGVGVVGAAAFFDLRGMDIMQRYISETVAREAQSQPLVRDFPSSHYSIDLENSDS